MSKSNWGRVGRDRGPTNTDSHRFRNMLRLSDSLTLCSFCLSDPQVKAISGTTLAAWDKHHGKYCERTVSNRALWG